MNLFKVFLNSQQKNKTISTKIPQWTTIKKTRRISTKRETKCSHPWGLYGTWIKPRFASTGHWPWGAFARGKGFFDAGGSLSNGGFPWVSLGFPSVFPWGWGCWTQSLEGIFEVFRGIGVKKELFSDQKKNIPGSKSNFHGSKKN